MLDKNVRYYPVEMRRPPVKGPPQGGWPPLPDGGWRLRCGQGGAERLAFARIECEVGEFACEEEALAYFDREFAPWPRELTRRFLLLEQEGRPMGVAFAWFGTMPGEGRVGRVRRVALRPCCQGRGLGRALVCGMLDIFAALEPGRPVYLTTQTWSWRAVALYEKYGFVPVRLPNDCNFSAAWGIIREKLGESGERRLPGGDLKPQNEMETAMESGRDKT